MDEMKNTVIALACDHGGYDLKKAAMAHFDAQNIQYIDFGCDGSPVDYPEYAHKLCQAIQNGDCEKGILFCGTGIGMCMAANKHKGIRAACCSDTFSAHATRSHNDANVLCLGGRVVGAGLALDIIDLFLSTAFESGRHVRRVEAVNAFDMQK